MKELEEFYYKMLRNRIISNSFDGLTLEFIGVIKDYNLFENKKSIPYLEYLIDCKIYLEQEEIEYHRQYENIFDLMEWDFNADFLDDFIHNNKKYRWNFKIYSEIYEASKYIIDNCLGFELNQDILFIISELNGCVDLDDKITLLKEKLKFYWRPFEHTSEFLLFMDERHDWEGQTWEDEIRSFLVEDDIFCVFYLTRSKEIDLKDSSYYNNHFKLWIEHYRKRRLIDFCKTEIERLKGVFNDQEKVIEIKKITENKDIKINSDIIFKENYVRLFNYIVKSYSDKKNKAFFSYLYHFFSNNGFLLKNKKSSVPYNNYLVCNNYIDEFSKVIQRGSENSKNSDEEKRMFEIFQTYYLKFIQIEIEGKLKEN